MFNFFERKNTKESKPVQQDLRILPSDVRYALQYKEAVLNKEEIEDLNMNHFENEALYMTIKGLQDNPEEQKLLMEKYVSYTLDKTGDTQKDNEALKNIISESLKDHNSLAVQGGKLAQLSRQGFDFWQEKFKQKAEELSEDKRNIFLVANAMMLGLGSFVESFAEKNKKLHIIIPHWVDNGDEVIGYEINFKDKKADVEFLKKTTDKDGAVTVLVDDATNSGKVFAKIKEYWTKDGSPEPDTIAISNLSGMSNKKKTDAS